MEQDIAAVVKEGKTIRIKSYAMLSETTRQIKKIIRETLIYYNKENLLEAIFIAVLELGINAMKANIKRIVFLDNRLDINNSDDYEKGLTLLRETLTKKTGENLATQCKEHDFAVWIDFIFGLEHFIIEIKNNALLTTQEEGRIRNKLSSSMQFEDIIDFYHHFADDEESAGLGISLVTQALRNGGIDPRCFSIFSQDNLTIARLEIPISENYVTRRSLYKTKQGADS